MLSRRTLARGRQIVANQISRRAWRDWRHMVANHGWAAVPAALSERLRRKFKAAEPIAKSDGVAGQDRAKADDRHPFDRDYGVDTSGLIWGEDLPSGSRNDTWNTAYYGIAPS